MVFAIYPLSSLGSHCAAISIRLVSIKKQCFCLLDLKIVFKKATLVLYSWIRLKEWGKVLIYQILKIMTNYLSFKCAIQLRIDLNFGQFYSYQVLGYISDILARMRIPSLTFLV